MAPAARRVPASPRRASERAQLLHLCGLPIFAAGIDLLIDGRYLLYPPPPVRVLKIEHGIWRPVKVISNEGYLLVQRL